MTDIRIGNLTEVLFTDYTLPPSVTRNGFYNFRNHVVRALRHFGTAGPMGEADVSVEDDEELEFDQKVVEEPDFFVVDDWYNAHDKLSIVECSVELISTELIYAVSAMASGFPGWEVSFGLGDSGMRVSGSQILVGGRRFWDCCSVAEIAERCLNPVEFGEPPSFPAVMYPFWVDMVSGRLRAPLKHAEASSREWAEVIKWMEDICWRRAGKTNSFDYGNVRQDLHPETRRQFVLKFFAELNSVSMDTFEEAKRNLQEAAGEALIGVPSAEELTSIFGRICAAQRELIDRIGPLEVVLWWSGILVRAKVEDDPSRPALIDELKKLLEAPNTLVRLSAVFALAQLRADNISSIIDRMLAANPIWIEHVTLADWLKRLRNGSRSYPDRGLSAVFAEL